MFQWSFFCDFVVARISSQLPEQKEGLFGPKFLLGLSYESQNIHVQNTFLRDSNQILQILEKCFRSKYFWIQNVFGPKQFRIQISFRPKLWITKHSCSIHIPGRFKTYKRKFGSNFFGPKMILLPNIFGPKFVLDLSYDSQNIHVQNTFLTDSEQIQNFWEIILDQNVCVPKFLLDLGYDLTKHSCSKHIPDRFTIN